MLQKLKSLRMAFTNAYTIIVAQLVEQFRFVRRRHSPHDFCHDSDPVASGFKLTRIRRMLATALVICVAALVGIAAAEEPEKCAVWGAIPKKP